MFKNFFKVEQKYWLIVFPIMHATIPWVQYRFKCIIPFAMMAFWLILVGNRFMMQKRDATLAPFWMSLFWMLLLWFMPTIYALFGYGKIIRYDQCATILNQLIFFMMAHYTFRERKLKEIRFLAVITLVCFAISGLCALKGLQIEGFEGARNMTGLKDTATDDQLYGAYQARLMGLGNYGFMYICCWMIAPLMWALVSCKIKSFRVLAAGALIGCFLCMKGGGLGTPVVVSGLSLILLALWYVSRWRKAISLVGSLLIVVYMLYATVPTIFSFMSVPFRMIAESLNKGSIQERFESMAETVSGNLDSYAYTRAQLQVKSWETFKSYPILGVFAHESRTAMAQLELGGHSYILDRMGGYGLVGTIPLIGFLVCIMQYFKALSNFLGRQWLIAPTIFMTMFVFSSLVNPTTGIPIQFYYVLPGLAVLVQWRKLNANVQYRMMLPPHNVVWM